MASNRINRINEEIQKELASLLRNLKDPRVSGTMTSITHVETTPDLRWCKVYVSFLEEDKAKELWEQKNKGETDCSPQTSIGYNKLVLSGDCIHMTFVHEESQHKNS